METKEVSGLNLIINRPAIIGQTFSAITYTKEDGIPDETIIEALNTLRSDQETFDLFILDTFTILLDLFKFPAIKDLSSRYKIYIDSNQIDICLLMNKIMDMDQEISGVLNIPTYKSTLIGLGLEAFITDFKLLGSDMAIKNLQHKTARIKEVILLGGKELLDNFSEELKTRLNIKRYSDILPDDYYVRELSGDSIVTLMCKFTDKFCRGGEEIID